MLTSLQRRLEDYPELNKWYAAQDRPGSNDQPIYQFIWSLCHGLKGQEADFIDQLPKIMEALMRSSMDLQSDIQKIEATLAKEGLRLNELLGEAAEVAIHRDQGPRYFELIREFADQTNLLIFRFLSAWTAFNLGNPEACLEECEKVDSPLSHFAVLQGQALLELGKVNEAIESFRIGSQLAPSDLLPKFQLAKALYIQQNFTAAWDVLTECRTFSNQNGEVALLTGVVCSEAGFVGDKAKTAWNLLYPHLHANNEHVEVVLCLMKLAIQIKDPNAIEQMLSVVKWKSMGSSPVFLKALAPLLRSFHQLEWFDLTAEFLAKLN